MKNPANLAQDHMQCLALMCKDIDQWPESWAGDNNDVIVGRIILREFKLYLLYLIAKGRTMATIKKHADYLWALGGEIIRDTNEYGVDKSLSSKSLVLKYVDDSGGPYWRHAYSESDLLQYDATCRKMYKFLTGKLQ